MGRSRGAWKRVSRDGVARVEEEEGGWFVHGQGGGLEVTHGGGRVPEWRAWMRRLRREEECWVRSQRREGEGRSCTQRRRKGLWVTVKKGKRRRRYGVWLRREKKECT